MDVENAPSPTPAPFSPGQYVPFGAEERRPLRPANAQLVRRRGGGAKSAHVPTATREERQLAALAHVPTTAQPARATREERQLAALRTETASRFDAASHEWMLRDLWMRARFGGEMQLVSPCWRSLGFQQDDPTTDLRGCGALGLRQLLHFCERGGGNEVLDSEDFCVAPFPLAGASLAVTLALCSHLRLLPDAASSRPPCAPPTLGHFLRFAAELEPARALDLIHAELLRGLADLWLTMQQPGLTLMHFPQALNLMSEHMACALAGARPPWQLCDVLREVRDVGGEMSASERSATVADLCSGSLFGWLGF